MCVCLCNIRVLFLFENEKFIRCFCFSFLKTFVPACNNRYWYDVIANTREHRFEVICPFKDFSIVKEDALVIVRNFRKVFKFAYPLSRRVDVYGMGITFDSVSNSTS